METRHGAESSTGNCSVPFDTGHRGESGVYSGVLNLGADGDTSQVACIQRVPGLMTAADFCMFVQSSADELLHIRMVRPKAERNTFMVLAVLKHESGYAAFAHAYQGKYYLQGLIDETCRVSPVCSGEMDTPDSSSNENSGRFPTSLLFPPELVTLSRSSSPSSGASGGADAVVDSSGTVESPSASANCTVCLEPLDAHVSPLVTTICNHTMHLTCLAKWDLASCPVCRHTHELVPEATACMSCGQTRGLWMCVICAYVGCDVYNNKHAHAHFNETHHPFAVNIEDSTFFTGDKIKAGTVWDYVADRFVNRLLSSEDGKVVEVSRDRGFGGAAASARLEGPSGSGMSSSGPARLEEGSAGLEENSSRSCGHRSVHKLLSSSSCCHTVASDDEEDDRGFHAAIYASRMDAVVNEYRCEVEQMKEDHGKAVSALLEENRRLTAVLEVRDADLSRTGEEKSAVQSELTKCRKQLTRRGSEAERDNRELRDRNTFLKNLNESLLRDKRSWEDEVKRLTASVAKKETEISEVQDDLRDMMLHLEAQAKVMGSPSGCRVDAGGSASEVSGGDILGIGPSQRDKRTRKPRRR